MRHLILGLGLTLLLAVSAQAREPLLDPESLVPVELATVGLDPFTRSPLVILREPGSGDVVPISIGPNEANAINRALQSVATPRPMTHDTMVTLVEAMGGRMERLLIDGMRDGTYFGLLDIRMADDDSEPLYVDTRPSDGLAMAARTGATILVAPEVLQATRGRDFQGLGQDQIVTAAGITVTDATDELRAELSLPDDPGVLVLRAAQAAEALGIRAGALITAVNGETPGSALDFLRLIQATESGDSAEIRFWLDGEEHTVAVDTDVPQRQQPQRRQQDQQFI